MTLLVILFPYLCFFIRFCCIRYTRRGGSLASFSRDENSYLNIKSSFDLARKKSIELVIIFFTEYWLSLCLCGGIMLTWTHRSILSLSQICLLTDIDWPFLQILWLGVQEVHAALSCMLKHGQEPPSIQISPLLLHFIGAFDLHTTFYNWGDVGCKQTPTLNTPLLYSGGGLNLHPTLYSRAKDGMRENSYPELSSTVI